MAGSETRTAQQMMTYEKDKKNKIAYLTLNRPDKMNAPDTAMRIRYGELLRRANADDDVKVLIVRGAGDHFGTGADLPEQQEKMAKDPLAEYAFDEDADVTCPPAQSFRRGFNFSSLYASTRGGCRSLQEFKKISIVEVKGYCYGWHFYQAGDADLVISSDDALYGHAAFRYAGWGPRLWTWIETIGLRKFEEMLFTGRPFTAREMYECNFINSMVPRAQLEDEVQKYALACARNGPTDRIVVQKTILEIYKQYRGEYLGSVLTSLIESLGPHLHADEGEFVLNAKVLKQGLAGKVKESEAQFPPEWRLSRSGRRNAR
jgi:enoyl-CoA hydratase